MSRLELLSRNIGLAILLATASLVAHAQCTFPPSASSAYDPDANAGAGAIHLPWRTDLPSAPGTSVFAWQGVRFESDWRDYMAAFLKEIRASGIHIDQRRLTMNPNAEWWIVPWMDYSLNGRERLNGLTAERGPDPGDLSKTSGNGIQTWAVGWYNRPGAYAIGQIFKDPCNPQAPATFAFPAQSASFKFLFTTADVGQVPYLEGSPEIDAYINPEGDPRGEKAGVNGREPRPMRLLQVDIAVKDPNAKDTGWVMGTFVWRKPLSPDGFKGDWLLDNLVPVGLMWGNDPGALDPVWNKTTTLSQSKINQELRGVVWSASEADWPQRPYPGFQGRLNGPADNPRSSCLACHAAAQWRRDQPLVDSFKLDSSFTPEKVRAHVSKFFMNTQGGTRHPGSMVGNPLDYSLQLEAAFDRICRACSDQKLQARTPDICKVPQVRNRGTIVTRDTCEASPVVNFFKTFVKPEALSETPYPRQ
ncbi:hypothetical protein [Pseudomonas sp. P9_31]|uniref:hypothetical protein n=1 Tax=Pseudomonas sp. P9_31 TaxID=3043448 RepID=UPI002A35C615|nr:hypothetical protein [Pseudomonas sp. P9_31]WPN55819.1 hypothetical protein QMK51_16705 [Pseudomonas sp. P9_31]